MKTERKKQKKVENTTSNQRNLISIETQSNSYYYSYGVSFQNVFANEHRKENEKSIDAIKSVIPSINGKPWLWVINPEHGDKIVEVDHYDLLTETKRIGEVKLTRPINKCDAIITRFDFPLAIFPADCLIVGIVDNKKGIKALIHAGWRGVLNEITVKTLKQYFRDSKKENIEVFIGPHISKESFRIGEDIIDMFYNFLRERNYKEKEIKKIIVYDEAQENYQVNLLSILLKQIRDFGEEKIYIFKEDTYSSKYINETENLKYKYCSYRRDKDNRRNIVIFI